MHLLRGRLGRSLWLGGALAATVGLGVATPQAEEAAAYLDRTLPLEHRVEDLLARLTLEEKVALLHGDGKFSTAAIPRLGIPQRWMADGPHGVREELSPDSWLPAGRTDDFATYMPVLLALASTWNPELGQSYGEVLGREARQRGKHILLGPGVNILRTPLCGRNFEYLGEDPYLAARLAVGYIRGVQSQQVAACVKHFAANNQEVERGSIDVEMDERTLREIYLPAFKAAVQEAGVLAVMGAYNKFRGQHCCHNDYLLNKVLKGEWGFPGLVMSDWSGTHDTHQAARNGLDLEMGTRERAYEEYFLARPFLDGLRSGELPTALVDDKARRNLRVMLATRALDGRDPGAINTPEHQRTARRVAEEGIVLLKNDRAVLPLDAQAISSLAVIGDNAVRRHAAGGGAAGIKAFYEVTPLEGILQRVGDRANVLFSAGYGPQCDAGCATRAVRAAAQADVAIVVAGLNHERFQDAEGADRRDLTLPYDQAELIRRVAAANPRTVVVLVSGGPTEMDAWLAQAGAVVQAWYAGMEGGHALARVLFGDVNPSGKLPCTFPRRLTDSPAHALGAYPGSAGTVRYAEGLFVGYRHFDSHNVDPLFAFGHGLSYTRFAYSDLKLLPGRDGQDPVVSVQFTLTNAGERSGAEVAQVYVRDVAASLPRPAKELKGFRKVELRAGEHTTVTIPLGREAFAFYEPRQAGWLAEKGAFEILIGSSSRDLRLKGIFGLPHTTFRREGAPAPR